MLIKNAKVFKENGSFEIGDIYIEQDRISDHSTDEFSLDGSGLYAIPGLTDLHFHGCAGYDFCDGSHAAFESIARYEASHGITTICPATMSLPEETLSVICKNVSTYKNEHGAILCGINMEGPFLNISKKGAQNGEHIHTPNLEMFNHLDELSGNKIKIVDIAPEVEGAMNFVSSLRDKKVISLAHTSANYDTAMEAFRWGANHVTHLYNAMSPLNHREPGVIGAASDTDHCNVELICDGIHIHPAVVRATFKLFGEDRVILISDSMMATGLPDGMYSLGGQEVNVVGKKATLVSDGAIAGSAFNLMDCMINAVRNMDIPLEIAVKAAAVNPAKAIGIYDNYGSITPGKVANIVLLDSDLNLKTIILKGVPIN